MRGVRPPTAVVLQGRTPETRFGCAGGGSRAVCYTQALFRLHEFVSMKHA